MEYFKLHTLSVFQSTDLFIDILFVLQSRNYREGNEILQACSSVICLFLERDLTMIDLIGNFTLLFSTCLPRVYE